MWPNSLSHLWQIVAIFADCVWIFFYMLISKHRSNIDCLKHLFFWRTVSCGFFLSIIISNMLFAPALRESDPTWGRLWVSVNLCMIMSVTLPQRSVHFFTTLSISFISPAVCIVMTNPSADTLLLQPAGRCSSEGSGLEVDAVPKAQSFHPSIVHRPETILLVQSQWEFHGHRYLD